MSKIDQSLSGWIKTPESERLQREYEHACATTNTAGEELEGNRIHGCLYRQTKSGRWRVNDPDGPRYKALGNSMAVPVMRLIGARIQQVESLP